MRHRGARAWLVVGLLVAGCGDPPPSTQGVGDRVREPAPRPRPTQDSLYDADGVPTPSDVVVAGLALPRGLTEVETSRERYHSYTSEVPVGPLLRYFGPRLTTVDIQQQSGRTTYVNAVPRDVRGGQVHLDVTIRTSSGHAARVEVEERRPDAPAGVVIDPDEIRRHLEELGRNRE